MKERVEKNKKRTNIENEEESKDRKMKTKAIN